MNLKAVFFDFDGTLVRSIDILVKIFSEVLAEKNLPVPPPAKLRKLIGYPLPEIFRTITRLENTSNIEKRFREIETIRNNANEITLVDTARETLKFLKSRNLRLGIISTKRVEVIEKLARELEVQKFFEIIVGRDLSSKPKPDPEPIIFDCKKLGISPCETIFAGDSLLDLESAKKAGMPFVGVLTGVCNRVEFAKNRADYIFEHIGKIANLVDKITEN